MSEISETVETQPEAVAPDDEPKTFDASYVAKLRQEAAKYRTEARENSQAAARLAEIEEASKTAEQKAAERLAELEAENARFKAAAQVAAWKTEVAKAAGVPIEALAGDTLEAIEAHAAILKPLITAPPQSLAPIPGEGTNPAIPLNGDGLEQALKSVLGIH